MPNLDSIEVVRSLSQTQINKLTNAQLKEALGTVLNAHTNDEPSNAILLQEIRNLAREIEQMKPIRKEVAELSSELKQAFNIINQQQRFLESLDARDRQKKIIITGVSEVADNIGRDDQSKVRQILDEADYDEGGDQS